MICESVVYDQMKFLKKKEWKLREQLVRVESRGVRELQQWGRKLLKTGVVFVTHNFFLLRERLTRIWRSLNRQDVNAANPRIAQPQTTWAATAQSFLSGPGTKHPLIRWIR